MTNEEIAKFQAAFKEAQVVAPPGDIAEVNWAMSMPVDALISTDERFFAIIEWHPHATMDEIVTIDCKLQVRIPKEKT